MTVETFEQRPSSGSASDSDILIEVPTDWLRHPNLGSSVRRLFANFCTASIELGYRTELSSASYWDDPSPRLPEAGQVCFSYHSFGDEPRVWRIKESYVLEYFTLDRLGYSGFSELARYPATFADAIAGFDMVLAEETVRQLKEKLVADNVSKYDQPDDARGQDLAPGYLFLPLQTTEDTVSRCSRILQTDALEVLAVHAARHGIPLVVKRHPLCRHDETGALLDRLAEQEAIRVSTASVHRLISGARAVVGANSGVLFEALLHGKPVYSYAVSDFETATQRIEDINGLEAVFCPYAGPSAADVTRFLGWYLVAYCIEANDLTKIRNRISQIVALETGREPPVIPSMRELLKRAFANAESSRRQTVLARTTVQQRIAIAAHDTAASVLLDLWRLQALASSGMLAGVRRMLGYPPPQPQPSLPPDVRSAPDQSCYADFYSTLDAYKSNNWLVSYLPTLATQKAGRVTEVGCGNGQFLRLAAEVFDEVVGADWVQTDTLPLEMINVRFVRTNLIEDPVPPADLVCSASVLEHIPGASIDSAIRKLTQAGPLQFHVIACYDDDHNHVAVYPPATWLALFWRHLPDAYIFDIKPQLDNPNRLICVITNIALEQLTDSASVPGQR